MSTGRAAALVIGLLAIPLVGFLLFGPVKHSSIECGSAIYPTDFRGAVAVNPAVFELFVAPCRDALQIRRAGAGVAGIAGVGLVIFGLVTAGDWLRAAPPPEQEHPPEANQADLTSQLTELRRLHDEGALDDDEYKAAKAKLLGDNGHAG